jgi:4-amino-4-deoxy-L-arabinose transferase-like glycosyltransferase
MKKSRPWSAIVFSDEGILILLALARLVTLLMTNGQSGWHRDELDTLDNARYLDWGYVAYPPLTPFIARVALVLFGPSLIGVRLFSTLAHAIALLLGGLMARELGGRRWAQVTTAVAVAIAPYALMSGELFHYSSFDYLWWVCAAYMMIRLLKSDDPRWWLGVGASIGLGLMTKYTMAILVASVVLGVILTRARRHLGSRWLWMGVGLSVLIVFPNLIWQVRHDFISLDLIGSIHARDVSEGRTEGFLLEQFVFAANPATIPLWLAGLYYYIVAREGRRYTLVGWLYVFSLGLFLITQGRTYYLAGAYPMLFAGGAVCLDRWLLCGPPLRARVVRGLLWGAFAAGGPLLAVVALPVAPVNSAAWNIASEINTELKEEIGWPELVETVAGIYHALSPAEQLQTGILTGNYGEAGAINLYGPAYGLPEAISGVNSYWLRGYGDPPPETLIVLGIGSFGARRIFESCEVAASSTNRFGVLNEETFEHPQILLCRGLRRPWPELWPRLQGFG